jgi:hypothetical protein
MIFLLSRSVPNQEESISGDELCWAYHRAAGVVLLSTHNSERSDQLSNVLTGADWLKGETPHALLGARGCVRPLIAAIGSAR